MLSYTLLLLWKQGLSSQWILVSSCCHKEMGIVLPLVPLLNGARCAVTLREDVLLLFPLL